MIQINFTSAGLPRAFTYVVGPASVANLLDVLNGVTVSTLVCTGAALSHSQPFVEAWCKAGRRMPLRTISSTLDGCVGGWGVALAACPGLKWHFVEYYGARCAINGRASEPEYYLGWLFFEEH